MYVHIFEIGNMVWASSSTSLLLHNLNSLSSLYILLHQSICISKSREPKLIWHIECLLMLRYLPSSSFFTHIWAFKWFLVDRKSPFPLGFCHFFSNFFHWIKSLLYRLIPQVGHFYLFPLQSQSIYVSYHDFSFVPPSSHIALMFFFMALRAHVTWSWDCVKSFLNSLKQEVEF